MKQGIHVYKANLFKALSHPLRLAILDSLRDGEKTVTQLQDLTGGEQAGISQHLKVLRHQHLVTSRRQGTLTYYRTEDAAHPGVAALYAQGDVYLAGPVTLFEVPRGEFPRAHRTPSEVREVIEDAGRHHRRG